MNMNSQPELGRGSTEVEGVVGGPGSSGKAAQTGHDRCALLSAGQLEVLRLVNQHLNSKEIAAELGISPHTVDQRVRGAIQRLEVTRRSEAARLVAAYDLSCAPSALGEEEKRASTAAYQRLIHQASHIDAGPGEGQTDVAVSFQIRHADRTEGVGAERLDTEQRTLPVRPLLFLPVSTPQQPSNRWGVGKRLATIVGIAIASSFSAGMFLAGLESLARLVHP